MRRMPPLAAAAQTTLEALPNRSHSFVKVVLHDTQRRRLSSVHFVDLVGNQVCACAPPPRHPPCARVF